MKIRVRLLVFRLPVRYNGYIRPTGGYSFAMKG